MKKHHFLIALLVVVLDRASKWLITVNIALYDSIPVLPGFFRLTHVQNSGAAFGLFDESASPWKIAILILFSVLALMVVSAMLWKDTRALSVTRVGLVLILGGAIGNLWDRLLSGNVVDFLDFCLGAHHLPAFNMADCAIVIGAFLMIRKILSAESPAQETVPGARMNARPMAPPQ